MPKKDSCDAALKKRKQGERMTLKEWQLTVYSASPSSLWLDLLVAEGRLTLTWSGRGIRYLL